MKVATQADRDTVSSNVKKLVEAFVNLLPFLEEKEVRDFVEVALADGIEDRAPSPYRIIKANEQIESLRGIAPAPKPQAKYQRAILWLSNTKVARSCSMATTDPTVHKTKEAAPALCATQCDEAAPHRVYRRSQNSEMKMKQR